MILFLTSFGALTGFTVIIGDLTRPAICEWSGHGVDCPVDLFYCNRNFLAAIILLVFIAPLAFKHTFHELLISSLLAFGSVVFLIIVIIARSIEYMVKNPNHEMPSLFMDDALGIIDAIPLLTFALGCHIQVIPIYSELKPAISSVKWMDAIVLTSNSTTTVLYFLVSLFGLLNFGSDTKGNILLNYPSSDILLTVARLLMAIHVALAYPLQSWAARNVLDHLLFQNAGDEDPKKKRHKNIRYAIMTVCILGFAFLGAAAIPDITIIFGFIGCLGSMFANFIFPPIFYLKLIESPTPMKIPAVMLIVIGFLVGIFGTASLVYQTIQQFQII